jgi:uncharacterized membrane protein
VLNSGKISYTIKLINVASTHFLMFGHIDYLEGLTQEKLLKLKNYKYCQYPILWMFGHVDLLNALIK